jgi:hypothetical protein
MFRGFLLFFLFDADPVRILIFSILNRRNIFLHAKFPVGQFFYPDDAFRIRIYSRIRIQSVQWIQEGKKDPQKLKKVKKFHVLKFLMFSESFSCSLDVF